MDKMDKLNPQTDGSSLDIVAENMEKLKNIFPDVFAEGKVDFEKLKENLGEYFEDSAERYSFNWNGKAKAKRIAQTPSTGTLRPCPEESVNWDSTKNLFIEGDNLEVLKLLQKSYHGKVKMIYIDPPYNTGKEFIYPDNYQDNLDTYLEYTNQKDEEGKKFSPNAETSGRYHTNWLNMMYPRLRLARNLLKDDGVIFISIDDNEVKNLKQICDEVFGEENFINQISLYTKASAGASGGGEDRKLKKNIEYVLMYSKNYNYWEPIVPIYKETRLSDYIQQMKADGKSFKYTNVLYKFDDVQYFKTIKDGAGEDILISKVNEFEIKTVKQIANIENISEEQVYEKYYDKIMTTTNAQTSIRDRVWQATDSENTMYTAEYTPKSGKNKGNIIRLVLMGKQKVLVIWLKDTSVKVKNKIFKREKTGTFWDGFSWINVTKEGGIKFENGKKPISLITQMVNLIPDNHESIIIDFFSGSATTAHGIMQQNCEDDGRRKYIMVQLPEPCDTKSDSYADGFCNIADIGKERIRRAGKKIQEENKDKEGIDKLDVGFKVFKLDSSNIKAWDADFENLEQTLIDSVHNIKEERTEEDLLYELLLKYGLDLTLPIEERQIEGKKVFIVAFGALVVCMDEAVGLETVEGIGKLKEELEPEVMRVVFQDSSFKDDVVKTNAIQTLRRFGIEDVKSL